MKEPLSSDDKFLVLINQIIDDNIDNEQFSVEELAKAAGISRSMLHRKLIKLIGKPASELITEKRLSQAKELLENDEATVSEIAYKVGYNSPSYFNKVFKKHYTVSPGELRKSNIVSKHSPNNIQTSTHQRKKLTRGKVFIISVILVVVVALGWLSYFFFIDDSFLQKAYSPDNKHLSIAVLPFKNLSDNPHNQYFAEGIREDILNDLYWITPLRVVSRTSADRFEKSNHSAREIARELNVKYVLEGSVRTYDNKVRISVQLIEAHRDNHLWSAQFDRELNDIIGVQAEIALQVASKVKVVLSETEIRLIEKIPTLNAAAYDYYLQGRFLLHKANSEQRFDFNKADVTNCIQYYEKAIAEDENFAEAYAGLANAWFNLSAWGWLPMGEGFLKARELSMKALEIDPECAEAHAVLGAFYIWGQRQLIPGGMELETSIRLNPNFATARQWYAQYLMITGPITEARLHINRALELEPYFWVVQTLNAWIYYFEEKNDLAIEACLLAQDLKPGFNDNEWLFVLNYTKLGEGEKAVQMLQTILKPYPEAEQHGIELRKAYTKDGIDGLFLWMINVNKNNPVPVQGLNGHPFYIAWWNVILGNKEEAIFWLQENMKQKNRVYVYFNLIATHPDFDILRDDPRFLKIIDDIGLTPYHDRITR
ncbi:MAG: helix-turn-helix domain-containing protein [Marinilabiliaceae bacterium]|nr:helix-turn-helix domain-containing protein [Marinilabiliaceae bacterium]